jgi:phosphopantothenoylcysteine decarboxylase/phosphopantothenate--cysteine ligase
MRDSGNRGTVVLGIGGGIAAYKVGDLVRRLRGQRLRVRVAMTPMAAHFVSPLTFQALSGEPVLTDLSDPRQDAAFGHLELARSADLAIVAPATADLVGKLANGLCDDPVTTTLIATACPLLLCPAMNTAMWANPKVQRNMDSLRAESRVRVVGPGVGLLADGDVGAGRLAEVPEIVRAALEALRLEELDESTSRLAGLTMDGMDLEGQKILVTAGPTREPLDPVRFLSNPSSGRMGYALAEAAARRGADVLLITGPVELPAPAGIKTVRIQTAEQLRDAALAALPGCTAIIAAAAVSDFRPREVLAHKKKKSGSQGETLDLVRTPDVLLAVSQAAGDGPARPVLVGFAAETDDLVESARRKLLEKRLDLVVANQVGGEGSAFGSSENQATLVDAEGADQLPRMSKGLLAEKILDRVVKLLNNPPPPGREVAPAVPAGARR